MDLSKEKASNFRECIMNEIEILRKKFTEELKNITSTNRDKES